MTPRIRRLRPQPDAPTLTPQAPLPLRQRARLPGASALSGVVFHEHLIREGKSGRQSVRGDSLTAAAQVITSPWQHHRLDEGDNAKRPGVQGWQTEAWDMRDETPELRFIGDRVARAASRVNLYIGKKPTPDAEPGPVDDKAVNDLSNQLFGNAAHVAQTVKRAVQHLVFNGESYQLIQETCSGVLDWQAYSSTEVTGHGQQIKINDGMTQTEVGENELLTRAWTPHPRQLLFPDAPVRAILPVARELRGLTQYVGAQVDSRLAGAGVLLLPEGIQSAFGPPRLDQDGEPISIGEEMTEYMITPITDRGSSASVVPYMLTVPPELVDKIKHVTFNSPLDPQAPQLRDEAIRRIALGMDSDPSVLLGQGTVNHWSGWLVSEDEVRLGVEPLVATICHALTVGFLHPVLLEMGYEDAEQFQVWWDSTPLELRPDRSKDAQLLFERGELSRDSYLRENGFTPNDFPTEQERERNLLLKAMEMRPDLAVPILARLGVPTNDLPQGAPASGPNPDVAPTPPDQAGGPLVTPPEGETRDRPERPDTPPAFEEEA